VRFALDFNDNGLRSCFDDDKVWWFFAKEVVVLNFTYKFEDVATL
jgi:hypothetical protein